MIENAPKRQHAIKFQASIPISATRESKKRFQTVVDAAANHLRALAGAAAFNVEVRAVYQDRVGPMMTWRDILVVCFFDGNLNETTKKMAIERKHFEFQKNTGMPHGPLDMDGVSSKPKKILLS